MPVGLPGLSGLNHKRTIRATPNPMDKATVFSIFPKEIIENKVTIQPGRFVIPAGTSEKPSSLIVGPSSWWREVDEEQPLLEIPNSAMQVADSLVKDYCNGMLAYDSSSRNPGLFYIPGSITVDQLKKEHSQVLVNAITRQKNWYAALVEIADTFWARSNGNPITISQEMRMAATALNFKNKDWMRDFTMMEQVRCVACGQSRNPEYPVCPHCHAVVDRKKAEELGILFAQTAVSK
jgi:hypothetical protein